MLRPGLANRGGTSLAYPSDAGAPERGRHAAPTLVAIATRRDQKQAQENHACLPKFLSRRHAPVDMQIDLAIEKLVHELSTAFLSNKFSFSFAASKRKIVGTVTSSRHMVGNEGLESKRFVQPSSDHEGTGRFQFDSPEIKLPRPLQRLA
jgi:hypothetical protein